MSPAQQPSKRSDANGTATTRKPRLRSTIGVNPFDLSPIPTTAEESPPAPPAQAGESDQNDAGQRVFAAWASGTENILKALFQTQNAALRANLSALEASANAQRRIANEWMQAARQAQAGALEAFQAGLQEAAPPRRTSECAWALADPDASGAPAEETNPTTLAQPLGGNK